MGRLEQRRAFLGSLIGGGLLLPSLASRLSYADPPELTEDTRDDERIALDDRANLPVELRNYVAYFTTSTHEGEFSEKLGQVLCGVVPSLSHKTDLKFQIPKRISDTVWRIDLAGLGWEGVWSYVIKTYYPYYHISVDRHKYTPIVVRADWFCADLYDEVETKDAQYQLLYSGKVPKNRDEFLAFWGVQNDSEYIYGMIEGDSKVAVNGRQKGKSTRQMENRTTNRRGYAWITKDSARIVGVTDPVRNLHLGPEGTEYDASEYIVGMYKVLDGVAGCLQAYFLTDGNRKLNNGQRQKGVRQAKAPVDIVEDTTNTRGREIRNSSSCIYCHTSGLLPPTQNEYRRYIARDTSVKFDYKTKYEVERYQGSDLEQEIALNNRLYEAAIKACTGLSASDFSAAYQNVVQAYVSPVTLPQLARELAFYYKKGYLTDIELQNAIAYASPRGLLNTRQADIGEEYVINRDTVILDYYRYQEVIQLWQQKSPPKR